ncbi:Na+/H+ antiporter NhaC [Secundilactobacillus paracollinoides]|uniref:Na+/H+ antiporter NhaC n=1 Tax=Secundilactobacillus paracollinoides TaxID=240427 RepID=A0A1B2IV68_9LACO|nr:Na+/H+ antiporter NhaC family protein [Secundilactobacillus paracollinoides]ANZ60125.1 Na+/H+ antiporter NhaC [Secundilactobacillus paracollinoides]ANZ62921.1 Na+/H+ antiporter NhaC [Secundilactobacillus paracollinoides]ANZ65919.1 Na+/H+ antiporter NhaC [Secundilactobacillus paracollinoides]
MMKVKLSLREAIIVLVIDLAIMGSGVIGLGLSPQVPVLLAITVTIFWAKFKGLDWDQINAGIKDGIDKGIIPIVIFILIGAMISTWIAAGTIPTLMVIGFKAISAQWFLPTVFGDKLSPLSETNNLAAAVVDTDLFDHMKTILWSTLPAAAISTVAFAVLSLGHSHANMGKINTTVAALSGDFHISIISLIPIVLVFVCAGFKMAAIPTMLLNVFVSAGMMFINQPSLSITKATDIITNGYVAKTANSEVNLLLSRGGIVSMMPTVALIVLTLSLGGLLVNFGLIGAIMTPLATKLNSHAKLVTAAIASCIGVNIFVGEQFLSIILPGRSFKDAFNNGGLQSSALGRVLEDGGTVLNYLVPWGVGGVFIANTLGVPTIQYLPFVFFSLLCPVMSLISGFTGIGLRTSAPKPAAKTAEA